MRMFFEEIGLAVGAAEKSAMGARHRAAHGSLVAEELVELVKFGNAYRTLFERVFLRLLGYEGEYVDRTTIGHPRRPLRTLLVVCERERLTNLRRNASSANA